MDDTSTKVQRWKGMTGKMHGVEVETTSRILRTICGIPVQQREIVITEEVRAEQITCQVCQDILHKRRK